MKKFNSVIQEKLQLNKQSKVVKLKDNNLISEIQNEIYDEGEFHTYEFTSGMNKFKKGFLYYSPDTSAIGIQAYNDIEKFEEALGAEPGSYSELDDLEASSYGYGDSVEIDDVTYIRLW